MLDTFYFHSANQWKVADSTAADSTALEPLALQLAKVYKPCALQVKKTELMEGVGDTHGIRSRRKEGIVEWLVRVLYIGQNAANIHS